MQWSALQGSGALRNATSCGAVVRKNQSRTGHGCLLAKQPSDGGVTATTSKGGREQKQAQIKVKIQQSTSKKGNAVALTAQHRGLKKPTKDVKHGMCCYVACPNRTADHAANVVAVAVQQASGKNQMKQPQSFQVDCCFCVSVAW